MTTNCGVYEIANSVTGKRYVGSAKRITIRFGGHRYHLRRGTHYSRTLQADWDEHGSGAFAFRQIIACAPANRLLYEQLAIEALRPEYNYLPIAGSPKGTNLSADTRKKLSLARIGNKNALGFKHSEETRLKVSRAQLGRKATPEHRAAISAALTGRKRAPFTDEARRNMGLALKGRKLTPEHRARIAEGQRGKKRGPLSDEHRAKVSAGVARAKAAKKAAMT